MAPEKSKIEVIALETVDSTNRYLKDAILRGELSEAAVSARSQSSGRGRSGRSWDSPAGGLYLSLSIALDPDVKKPIAACIAAGVAITSLLRERFQVAAGLKWPNDIIVKGGKLCGLLSELVTSPEGAVYVIIGIGMNVVTPVDPAEAVHPVTWLGRETGTPPQVGELAKMVTESILGEWERVKSEGMGPSLKRWSELSETVGETVEVSTVNGVVSGVCAGVTDDFELIVRIGENGREILLSEGDCRLLRSGMTEGK